MQTEVLEISRRSLNERKNNDIILARTSGTAEKSIVVKMVKLKQSIQEF